MKKWYFHLTTNPTFPEPGGLYICYCMKILHYMKLKLVVQKINSIGLSFLYNFLDILTVTILFDVRV